MKTRTSLVSNSSSSSFIVVFPNRPKSVDDVHKFMFNGLDGSIKSNYSEYSQTNREISESVFNTLKEKMRIASMKDLEEEFRSLVHHDVYYAFENGCRRDQDYDDIHKMLECVDMFGSPDYLKILKDIQNIDNEYNSRGDELVRKYNVAGLHYDKYPKEYNDARAKLDQERWDKQRPLQNKKDKILDKKAKARVKDFIENHKGWWYTIISYSDNEGEHGSFMEHSNIFRHLNHIQISHH